MLLPSHCRAALSPDRYWPISGCTFFYCHQLLPLIIVIVTSSRRLDTKLPEGSTRAEIVLGCPMLDRSSRDAELMVFRVSFVSLEAIALELSLTGCATGTSIEECVQHQKLRWLGHVWRMPNHHLPKRVLFSMPNPEWRNQRGGQPLGWERGMKKMPSVLLAFQDGDHVIPSAPGDDDILYLSGIPTCLLPK
ncbi:hypothetical protein CSKR_107652 [Clonorchis sinensis]|uniref:Uncharacterized protein n=1 Tax=Clonorchis sinensis TaxID=79923 RepID=A0A3R7CZB0_CLOSI|nr:hypothetical protein CSKR_107652 [Clonorchis sinensis]